MSNGSNGAFAGMRFGSEPERLMTARAIQGKRVLLISAFDRAYFRVKQECALLEASAASYTCIAPGSGRGIKPASWLRLLSVVWQAFVIPKRQYDSVFVTGLPQCIVPFLRVRRHQTLIVDFFISLFDTLVLERRSVRAETPLASLLRRLDTRTARNADLLIADTRAHARYFCSEFGAQSARIAVLYAWADPAIFYPRTAALTEQVRTRFTVFFYGAMNPLQGVETILQAAKKLHDAGERDICFQLIGPIHKLGAQCMQRCGELVQCIGEWLPEERIAAYIGEADLCLAGHFAMHIDKASRVIPSKVFAYRAMGKPVVLGDNAATRELFGEKDRGVFFVEMGNPDSLCAVVVKARKLLSRGGCATVSRSFGGKPAGREAGPV